VDYRTYLSRKTLDTGPRLTLLLQVDRSGHAREGYRFTVEGGPWDTDIWTRDLFDPASLGGYRLRYQLRGEDIELKTNALASKWEDVDALLGRGVLIAMKAGDTTDRTEEFRARLAAEKEADPNFGAAVRWAVQAANHGGLKLILQGLPGEARRLRSEPLLAADETETITLETLDAEADMEEVGPCRGPIPVLFARDREAVRTTLELHPERVYAGI
jgi:hypothetical protein